MSDIVAWKEIKMIDGKLMVFFILKVREISKEASNFPFSHILRLGDEVLESKKHRTQNAKCRKRTAHFLSHNFCSEIMDIATGSCFWTFIYWVYYNVFECLAKGLWNKHEIHISVRTDLCCVIMFATLIYSSQTWTFLQLL